MFLGDRRQTPGLLRPAAPPIPQPFRARATARGPTTPQRHPGGHPDSYLHALPPQTPPSSGGRPHTREEANPASSVPQQRTANSSLTSRRRQGWGGLLAYGRPGQNLRRALAAWLSAPLVPPGSRALLSLTQFPVLCPELLRARRQAISWSGELGA